MRKLCVAFLVGVAAIPSGVARAQYGQLPPAITGATFTVNPNNVLSGVIEFNTIDPQPPPTPALTRATVTVIGPDGAWIVPPEARLTEATASTHRFNIVGLRAEQSYTFRLGARNQLGLDATPVNVPHMTAALPAYFPPIETLASQPEKMAPGYTYFLANSANFKETPESPLLGLYIAVDSQGRVVWYHAAAWRSFASGDTKVVANGRFLSIGGATIGGGLLKEFDYMGEVVPGREWTTEGPARDPMNPDADPTTIAADGAHHAVSEVPLEGGKVNYVFLSTELRTLAGYGGFIDALGDPLADEQPVLGDVIVEFDPDTGEVVKEYSTLDFLDPLRVDPTRGATAKTDFLSNGFNGYYGTTTRDWTHGNGVVYDAARNDYVVSLRHQDIVVAIDRDTGALEWVLGADDPATSGDDDWPFLALAGGSLPYHTHDPTILPNGDLMVYDNGVIRPEAFFARPARFALDLSEEARTATQAWDFVDKDYNAGGGPVSIIIGSARLQAGGRSVLVSNGAFAPCGNPPGPCAAQWYGNIVEVAQEIPQGEAQEKLFEINVGRTYGAQVLTYRAERYPSLYVNIPRDQVCGTVPLSTGQAGQAVELQNVVDGLTAATVGSVGACLARLTGGS